MHPTAKENCRSFYSTYHLSLMEHDPNYSIVEIGSQDVNGSLRDIFPPGISYTGVDFVEGNGVDVILQDPYKLPFEDGSVDLVLSSSCFEHSEMFWVLHQEIMRILKPHGLFYLNVPNNGDVHQWPVDCWRFYPDSGKALVTWSKHNGMNPALLESYVSAQNKGIWNDFVAVFVKDESFAGSYQYRILDTKADIWNGIKYGSDEVIRKTSMSEDQKKLEIIRQILRDDIKVN